MSFSPDFSQKAADVPFEFYTQKKLFHRALLVPVLKDFVRHPLKPGSLREWFVVRNMLVQGCCQYNRVKREQHIAINLEPMSGCSLEYVSMVIVHEYVHAVISEIVPEVRGDNKFQLGEERVVDVMAGRCDYVFGVRA